MAGKMHRHQESSSLSRRVSGTCVRTEQSRVDVEHARSGPKRSAKTSAGLRTIAVFEAAKGSIVLLLGCGALDLIHKNVADVAEQLTEILRVNPDGRLSNLFWKLASQATDRLLWALAIGALVYATVRLIEAYGLWREREWAQWFALLSTALYLPGEVYWLLRHPSWLRCGVLLLNIVILLFMLILRITGFRRRQIPFTPAATAPMAMR